jgi:hypothetical protein
MARQVMGLARNYDKLMEGLSSYLSLTRRAAGGRTWAANQGGRPNRNSPVPPFDRLLDARHSFFERVERRPSYGDKLAALRGQGSLAGGAVENAAQTQLALPANPG